VVGDGVEEVRSSDFSVRWLPFHIDWPFHNPRFGNNPTVIIMRPADGVVEGKNWAIFGARGHELGVV
jgi:hypothetical protein